MRELLEGYTKQIQMALDAATKLQLTKPQNEIRNLVIAGLGGSGIGGTLAEAITYDEIKVPVAIAKAYDVPAFVDKHTLLIACSFSGNTEETLDCVEKALKAGAKVTAITTGGALAKVAKDKGCDLVQFQGLAACPRQHLPYSLMLLLLTIKGYGLVKADYEGQARNAAKIIDTQYDKLLATADGYAKALIGKFPVLYSDTKLGGLTVRFQQQINENSKQLAHTNVFPEMNHNELVGWEKLEGMLKDSVVMMFRTNLEHPRIKVRLDICEGIFAKKAGKVINVVAQGSTLLEQVLYYTFITDWVSFFLAEYNGVDPFPVDVITYLKNELAKI